MRQPDETTDVLVVGGGNAGISTAARLLRDGARDVMVLTPGDVHLYRPLLSYVGSGEASMRDLERGMAEVLPPGCRRVDDAAVGVEVEGCLTVLTRDGRRIACSTLVLCPGLEEAWDLTPGLAGAYDAGWAVSTFVATTAPRVWEAVRSLRSGSAVFTVPPEPAPCAATALKPLLMACDHWRREGVLERIRVHLVLPGRGVTGQPEPDRRLEEVLAAAGVEVLREARVVAVDHLDRSVTVATPAGEQALDGVDLAHLVPHYRAPAWIRASGLADDGAAGLLDVDPETLRHRRHPRIWGLGDAAALHTRPSGGALRKQVAVLAHNLAHADSTDEGGTEPQRYDGYTVMPITTDRRRLMLVEVDRAGRPVPSVPFPDMTVPRRLTWLVDRYALPVTYFRRILKGKV
ncbi:FAD/NAD(P)-binding oxidoreductase [Nocardioides nanhaiensis]|uniref:FAD/NAD(P)-binding oxidoreductase n=1 Tax=Nocardioides nanhaiensis TaxID=1476871 RepID=A0ABP8VQ30_9ACTN